MPGGASEAARTGLLRSGNRVCSRPGGSRWACSHPGGMGGAALSCLRQRDVARSPWSPQGGAAGLTGGPWGPGGPGGCGGQVQAEGRAGQASPSIWKDETPLVKQALPGLLSDPGAQGGHGRLGPGNLHTHPRRPGEGEDRHRPQHGQAGVGTWPPSARPQPPCGWGLPSHPNLPCPQGLRDAPRGHLLQEACPDLPASRPGRAVDRRPRGPGWALTHLPVRGARSTCPPPPRCRCRPPAAAAAAAAKREGSMVGRVWPGGGEAGVPGPLRQAGPSQGSPPPSCSAGPGPWPASPA